MDRVEIKSLAREKIKGNLLAIWWPLIVVVIIAGLAGWIGGIVAEHVPFLGAIVSFIITIAAGILGSSYTAYLLKFVRGENPDFNVIIDCFKEKWKAILITSILVAVYTALWSLLFVIPGIVKGFAYTMALLIVIDTDLSGNDAIKESMQMMDGYKLDYFVFTLSFIGWQLLACITFGILYIFVFPYMTVAQMIYYDKLREKKGMTSSNSYASKTNVSSETTYDEPINTTEPSTPSLEDTIVGGDDNDPISNK